VVSPVDAEALRRVLDGRWGHVRGAVRHDLGPEWFEPVSDLTTDEHRARVTGQAHALARHGQQRLGFEKEFGGGDDIGGQLTSFEMLGFADLSLMVKAGVQWGLFGGAVQALGTRTHHARYLPDIMSLDLAGCFAMTETGHGSDVQALGTTATYDEVAQQFVINTPDDPARKDYIGNAACDGRLAVVFAQLVTRGENHGVHAILVPIRDEGGQHCAGVRIEDCGHKGGLNGVDNGRLWFDQVRVPREALLDRYAQVAEDGTYSSPIENASRRFFTMLGALVRGRVCIGAASGSATKLALTIAVRYGEVRRQFRTPGNDDEITVLDYLAHQRKLLPALATSYALHFAQGELTAELHEVQSARDAGGTGTDDELRQRELESRAAGMKAITSWHASTTIQACREACGGAGYLSANRLTQLKADTDIFTTFEGDNTVLLQLVAKGMLTSYRDQFGDLNTLGTMRFLADQVAEAVIERTSARGLIERLRAAAPGRDEDADLRDRAWHISLFEWREKHCLDGLARRLRRAAGDGADPFDVVNQSQDHMLRAAHNHVHRVVLEAFVTAIDACEDPDVAALLNDVCDLYALAELESDRAWFLEHGRLTASVSKGLTRAVNELCARLRRDAGLLVDGFGIPASWLGAEIAR
jgi:acyl-CoA oxidase